ncbi:uncharacterized protein LOC131597832 [Vicia villosa]|uniref:uncharacterized protein LOC131597832 n=1 Tax=Vicia villosa TaxID=3911 RepID=UPI00273BB337|nr:uncharacterized protein LOC131597832 [Vicia villosa]
MNILFSNIRGCNSALKRRKLRSIIAKGQPDVMFLQETKIQNMSESFAESLWGNENIEWSAKDSNGASGGTIILWKKGCIEPLFSFRAEGVLGIGAEHKGQLYSFVNIYSSCAMIGKRKLWSELVELKNRLAGSWWCIGGDFNSIRGRTERMGRCMNTRSTEMEEFNEFIDLLDLIDVPVVGGRFTWSNKEGNVRSRLDRFLLSDGLIDDWKIVGQKVGDMDISDHVPIWLIANDKNWGPKPFRVNNCWFENKDFKKFVEEAWNDVSVAGRQDFVMKEKLKLLKSKLRVWNIEKFGWIDLKIEEATAKINRRDHYQDGSGQRVGGGLEDEIKKAKDDLWKHLSLKENLLRQKSRKKWIKEGDQNTKYFHHSIKDRRRRNNIVAVTSVGGRCREY